MKGINSCGSVARFVVNHLGKKQSNFSFWSWYGMTVTEEVYRAAQHSAKKKRISG